MITVDRSTMALDKAMALVAKAFGKL